MSISLRPLSSSSTVRTASRAMLQASSDQRLRALVLMAEWMIFSIMERSVVSTGLLFGGVKGQLVTSLNTIQTTYAQSKSVLGQYFDSIFIFLKNTKPVNSLFFSETLSCISFVLGQNKTWRRHSGDLCQTHFQPVCGYTVSKEAMLPGWRWAGVFRFTAVQSCNYYFILTSSLSVPDLLQSLQHVLQGLSVGTDDDGRVHLLLQELLRYRQHLAS